MPTLLELPPLGGAAAEPFAWATLVIVLVVTGWIVCGASEE
jgi:hypothetical protein